MRKISAPCSLFFLIHYLVFSLAPSSDGGESPGQEISFIVHAEGIFREGQTVKLSCHVQGTSTASFIRPSSYIWVKDGEVIPEQTEVAFNLGPLTKQHEGNYQCGGQDSTITRFKYQLNVYGNDVMPKPHIFQSGVPVCGRELELNCVIRQNYTANAKIQYIWYKDSAKLKDESDPLLRFAKLTVADDGNYECVATQGTAETTSSPSKVYHLKSFVTPEVHINPTSPDSVVRGVLRENLTLTCEVTRAFPPVPMNGYSWSYLPSNQERSQPLEEKSSTLTLSPLTRNHSGQYQCEARNYHDYPDLDLTGQDSVKVDVIYLENISMPSDLEVPESEPLTLTCNVHSHPVAQLTWTVNGKVVRHVTANLDHYFIPSTSCFDSGNYTCSASNAYMPRRTVASTFVQVDCKGDSRYRPVQPGTIYLDVSAPFDFLLPEDIAMVVVHPSGQDIITFHPNCSSNVSPAFVYRCLHPQCNLGNHHVSFTLTQLSDKDEGNYVCFENGERGKLIPNSTRTLVIRRQVLDGMPPEAKVWMAIAIVSTLLFLFIVVMLIIRHRRQMTKALIFLYRKFDLERVFFIPSPSEPWTYEGSHKFEKLYKKGEVYIFPKLVPTKKEPEAVKEENSSESTSLMMESDALLEEASYTVKDLVRVTLQQLTPKKDPPSFVLHNTRLSRDENIILILSRKVGVVVMLVKAVEDENDLDSLKESTEHLLEARKIVKEKVEGLVHASSITAVIALPNLPSSDLTFLRRKVKTLDSNRDVEVVFGMEKKNFSEWAERLSNRPNKEVWDCSHSQIDSSDTAYVETASKFLTLAGSCPPVESSIYPTVAETWLLTPEQMEVRDSLAQRLHIWGSPGSGKTMLLTHKARQWLADGKAVVIVVGREIYDVLLSHVADTISREQKKETKEKLQVCRTNTAMQKAIENLKAQYPDVEICIVIHTVPDTEIFEGTLQAVKSGQTSAVWSVCPANLQAFDEHLSKRASDLGWETANLSLCVRCTKNTVELLNVLGKGSPDHGEIASSSITPDDDVRKWEVLDHCRHPDHTSTMYTCQQCREKMNRILSLQGQDLKWRDWIALYTGDPNVLSEIKHLCTTLRTLGLPACLDKLDDIFAGHDSGLNASDIASRTEKNKWWDRMVNGVDERGNPAVHLIRMKDFSSGLEKENVLLVHWDERDDNPTHQNPEKRQQRLEEHSRQWIRGVSRSKGQVILLLLTPSPARSLLSLPEAVLPVP